MKQIYLRQASKGRIIYSVGDYNAKLMRATKMFDWSNRWLTWQKVPIIALNVNLSNAKNKINIRVLNTAPRTRVIINHGILLQNTSDVELWSLHSTLPWITCRTNSRLGGKMRRHFNGKNTTWPRLHNSILSPIGWNWHLSAPAVATQPHWVL